MTSPGMRSGQGEPVRASLVLRTTSEDATRAVGVQLAQGLRCGDLIGLRGELGAGKTVLVRGIAQGLRIPSHKVRSPTFTLINEYSGGRLPLYHVDLYRIAPSDVDRLALREYLYGDGVCVVEWIERLGENPPQLAIDLTFVGESERTLVVTAHGDRYDTLLNTLRDG